jgi:Protein of unknown function (DUF2852)
MTYDTQASGHPFNRDGDYLGWAKSPGFNMPKLLAVLAGLAIFPPLGIAALIYFLWNSRRDDRHGFAGRRGCGRRGSTGNAAFDEHRAEVLRGLEEERQAFRAHRAEERRKRDAEALDAFRAAQKAAKDAGGEQS